MPELGRSPVLATPDALVVGFAWLLRAVGLDVSPAATVTFARGAAAVGMGSPTGLYWAGRATLVQRPDDIDTYDRAFAAYWHGRARAPAPPATSGGLSVARDTEQPAADGAAAGAPPRSEHTATAAAPVLAVRWSPTEVLRHRDFAAYDAAEFEEVRRLIADVRFAGPRRRSRRRQRSTLPRGHLDVRRTARAALRTGGEPFSRRFVERSARPRRIVLLCDVSGSMEAYSRAFVRFLHAAVVARGRVEAFALGTRLTRITRQLSSRDPDAAVAAAAARVRDWSGGTRLGESLRTFNDEWGSRGMARGAVVVVLSDGWDRGEPELVAEQMARLARLAHRIVWANPLKASPGYAPLAAGMAAALPHVDEFVEGHSLAALESIAAALGR